MKKYLLMVLFLFLYNIGYSEFFTDSTYTQRGKFAILKAEQANISSTTISGKITLPDGTILTSTSTLGGGFYDTQINNIQLATTTLRTDLQAVGVATGTISGDLTTETNNRIASDNSIGVATTTIRSDLTTETTNRQTGDNNLGYSTGIISGITSQLQLDTTTLNINLNTEISNRQTGDNNLGFSTGIINGIVNQLSIDTTTIQNNFSNYGLLSGTQTFTGENTFQNNINLSGKQLINVSTITISGENIVISPFSPSGNYNFAISIGSNSYNNYSHGIGIGNAHTNYTYGVGIGIAYNNYNYGVGVGYSTYNNYDYGVGIGYDTYANHTSGIGIGRSAYNNFNYGIGIGRVARTNYTSGIGIGYYAEANYSYGIGIGYYAYNNYGSGIGIGDNASNNRYYGIGIGYYATSKSSSIAIGCSAKSTNIENIAIGAGAIATAKNSIALGAYCVNNTTNSIKIADDYIMNISSIQVKGNIKPEINKISSLGTSALSWLTVYASSYFVTTPDLLSPEKALEWLVGISTTSEKGTINKIDKKTYGNAYRKKYDNETIKTIDKIYITTSTIITKDIEIKEEQVLIPEKLIENPLPEDESHLIDSIPEDENLLIDSIPAEPVYETKYYYEKENIFESEEAIDIGQSLINLIYANKKLLERIEKLEKK